MTDNERKAWQTANVLWRELNLISQRISTGPIGIASWSDTERQHLKRTLDLALDILNEALDCATNAKIERKEHENEPE